MYLDDPCFSKTKIIYSIYDCPFQAVLGNRLAVKLKQDGATDKDLKIVETPNFLSVTKLAIQFSDAIIQGSMNIDPITIEHIEKSKKLFLAYQSSDNYIDMYNEFYDMVIATKQKK
jgi:starch synthase